LFFFFFTKGLFGCNIDITEEGTFGPATFPSMYTDPVVCKYRIIVPEKHKLQLTFLYVDFQDSDCSSDSVTVYKGRKAVLRNQLTQFCNGTHGDIVTTSTKSRITVMFKGSTPNKYQGFHASVQFL